MTLDNMTKWINITAALVSLIGGLAGAGSLVWFLSTDHSLLLNTSELVTQHDRTRFPAVEAKQEAQGKSLVRLDERVRNHIQPNTPTPMEGL